MSWSYFWRKSGEVVSAVCIAPPHRESTLLFNFDFDFLALGRLGLGESDFKNTVFIG
jgi:hypothetical protein